MHFGLATSRVYLKERNCLRDNFGPICEIKSSQKIHQLMMVMSKIFYKIPNNRSREDIERKM